MGDPNEPDFDSSKSYTRTRPANVIVGMTVEMLDKSKAANWTRKMRGHLGQAGLRNFIDGLVPEPDPNDPTHALWHDDNELIRSLITANVPEIMVAELENHRLASEMWNAVSCDKKTENHYLDIFYAIQDATRNGNTGEQTMDIINSNIARLRQLEPNCSDVMLITVAMLAFHRRSRAVDAIDTLKEKPSVPYAMRILSKHAIYDKEPVPSTSTGSSSQRIASARPPHRDVSRPMPYKKKPNIQCEFCKNYSHDISECNILKRKIAQTQDAKNAPKNVKSFSSNNKHSSAYFSVSAWLLDSGASRHCTFDKSVLSNFKSFNQTKEIFSFSGHIVRVEGSGDAIIPLPNGRTLHLHNVWFTPEANENIISVFWLAQVGHKIIFFSDYAQVFDKQMNKMFTIKATHQTYELNQDNAHERVSSVRSISDSSNNKAMLWHIRLGHLNLKQLRPILDRLKVKCPNELNCITCLKGKITAKPFAQSRPRATRPLEIIHSDVCGPFQKQSDRKRYFITFIDDFTRMVFVYGLKEKGQAFDAFTSFKSLVENQTDQKIKQLWTDNGREYENTNFKNICEKFGIVHHKTVPHTPELNGVAERMNRTLCESARCMLIQSGLPQNYWLYAIKHATKIRNMCPSRSVTDNGIPLELWTNQTIDHRKLHIFGTTCIVKDRNPTIGKFDPRGKELTYIGDTSESGIYILCDKELRTTRARDVCFLEEATPHIGTKDTLKLSDESEETLDELTNWDEVETTEPIQFNTEEINENDQIDQVIDEQNDIQQSISAETEQINSPEMGEEQLNINKAPKETQETGGVEKTTRKRKRKAKQTPAPKWKRDENGRTVRINRISTQIEPIEPKRYKDIAQRPDANKWIEAMNVEMKQHETNGTWQLVKKPPNAHVISNTWVYKLKLNTDGSINKYKARLVAHGFRQWYGSEYNATEAPVARTSSVKMLLAIAHNKKMKLHQLDITGAYLNGEIQETIYMEQPKGFVNPSKPGHVCQLKKALYGLKQAGLEWNKKLTSFILSIGFKKTTSDCCVFSHQNGKEYAIILVHVDDILIAYQSKSTIDRIINQFKNEFQVTETDKVKHFLGIEIGHDIDRGYWMSQDHYIRDLLIEYQMDKAKPCDTPLVAREDIAPTQENDKLIEPKTYQKIIGQLNYLATQTRPDISFATNRLAQFNQKPCERHMNLTRHILRYLKGTAKFKLYLTCNNLNKLEAYTDASFGPSQYDTKSITGYTVLLGGALIEWGSKKQTTTVTSTAYAEYIAMSTTSEHLQFFEQFLTELKLRDDNTPTPIMHCDNQAAIAITEQTQLSHASRSIKLRFHNVRERALNNEIQIVYQPSDTMLADLLTKVVDAKTGKRLTHLLNFQFE